MCEFYKALVLHPAELSDLAYIIWEDAQDTLDISDILNEDKIIDYITGYLEELLSLCGCEDFLILCDNDRWELVSESYLGPYLYEHHIKYYIEYFKEKNQAQQK
ncbi:TPA: hypothetical protein [Thermocrinis Great Boiling Spring virus]|jgi:hypothetical protein|nr:TPA: hypothetical protein [Thermocrinis Great Boiling Spring virus]